VSRRLDEAVAALAAHREERLRKPPTFWSEPTDPVDRVTERAGQRWRAHALEAVRQAASRSERITVDDVHRFLTEPTYDLRALGGVMREAARRRWIERDGHAYIVSARPETHGRPLALWRSRIHD
jgi:hypothetical protein